MHERKRIARIKTKKGDALVEIIEQCSEEEEGYDRRCKVPGCKKLLHRHFVHRATGRKLTPVKRVLVTTLLLCGCAAEQAAIHTENAVAGLAKGLTAETAMVATSIAKTFDGLTALTSEAQVAMRALHTDAVSGGHELLLLVASAIVLVVVLTAWRIHAKIGRVHQAVLEKGAMNGSTSE